MDAGSQQPANAMDVKAAVNDVVMAITLMRCTAKVLFHKISLDQDACRDESTSNGTVHGPKKVVDASRRQVRLRCHCPIAPRLARKCFANS